MHRRKVRFHHPAAPLAEPSEHGVLIPPTATRRTVTIVAFIRSYQRPSPLSARIGSWTGEDAVKQADASSTALEALSHPLILKGAWLRVDGWFRSGNLAPEPELSRWRLHAEAALRELGAELADNTWRPDCWQQVPYPKKGACLRHYVQPTVRDQVAFMAYLVLLGPLLDRHVPPFVFGNRWNRAISWDRRQAKPHWVHRPYQLLTSSSYLRYSRSHGLFRRVAHWTAARITGAEIDHQDFAGHVQHPEDYEDSSLPPWIRERWWSKRDSGDARAFWATLDIELAYPSIYLDRLRSAMRFMLLDPLSESDLNMLYGGYPAPVMRVLANPHSVQAYRGPPHRRT